MSMVCVLPTHQETVLTMRVGLLFVGLFRAAQACSTEFFGSGLGNPKVVDDNNLHDAPCVPGQRVDYIIVFHGAWTDGVKMKCTGDDETTLMGVSNDGSTTVCRGGSNSGISNITSSFSNQTIVQMVVTCLDYTSGERDEVVIGDTVR